MKYVHAYMHVNPSFLPLKYNSFSETNLLKIQVFKAQKILSINRNL